MADIDDLKAAYEQGRQTFNAQNLDAFVATLHDEIVAFGTFGPFPVEGKAAFRQLCQTLFATYESDTFTPINPQCRVIGTTGLVWGHHAVAQKPKDGPMTTVFVRSTFTFVKSDGKWLVVSLHHSRLPSGN